MPHVKDDSRPLLGVVLAGTYPDFHFLLTVDAFWNSLDGSQWCLLKPSWALLKNVNPSVSNNITQTVPGLVLSTMSKSYPGDRQDLLYLVSFSSTYRGSLCASLKPGEGHTEKAGNRQVLAAVSCVFLWLWGFSVGRDNAGCGSLVSVFLHTAEKGCLNLWFYIEKWLRKGKSTLCLLHTELAWLSNIWGLGSYVILNGTQCEISHPMWDI